MDKKQIIHIAGESVIILGLATYFKLKNDSLLSKIQDLEKRVDSNERIIEQFENRMILEEKIINKHEQMISQLLLKKKNTDENDTEDYEYIPHRRIEQKQNKPRSTVESKQKIQFIPHSLYRHSNESRETPISRHSNESRETPISRHSNESRETPISRHSREVKLRENETKRETRTKINSPILSPQHSENLDEEILNELNELSENENENELENEEVEIEIDTSLKKKV
jgi:hypothetical protein